MRPPLVVETLLPIVAVLLGDGCAAPPAQRSTPASYSFALYALSRGKGVPEATRSALREARELLEEAKRRGEVVYLGQTRIGLEGETRLCVEFADPQVGRDAQERIRRIIQDVELINLVVEPCWKSRTESRGGD